VSLDVNVQGGTDAGNRKPFDGQPPDWHCACEIRLDYDSTWAFRLNPGYLTRCHVCGTERPT
jgi:hypothetical protein